MSVVRSTLVRLADQANGRLRAIRRTTSAHRVSVRWRDMSPRRWTVWGRAILPLLVYAVGFLVAESVAWLLAFALSPQVEASTPLFIQGAVTVAALLLVPPRQWWMYLGLTVALVPVNAWLFHASPSWDVFWTLLLLSLAILSLAVGTVSLIRRFVMLPMGFSTARNVTRFVLCVCGGAVVPACLVTVGRIFIFDWTFWFSWETAYFGYALAILVFTPAIVLWATADLHALRATARGRSSEILLLACAFVAVSAIVFGVRYHEGAFPRSLIYLLVPLLMWAAVRFSPRGTLSALALITGVAVIGTIRGVGPFVGQSAIANVFTLQLFLLFVCVPLFFLAAVTQERAVATTHLHESAMRLQESEARFRTMADQAPVLIWMSGPDALCTYFNAVWHRFTGRSDVQERGNGWAEGVHPDDLAACLEGYQRAFDARRPFTLEYRLRRHDGVYRWILDEGIPRYAPNRTFEGYIGSCIDITERKQLERERTRAAVLEARSHEFQTLADHSPDVIARLDPSGRYLYVNQRGADLLGLPAEHWVGKTFAELDFTQSIAKPAAQAFQEVIQARASRSLDTEVLVSDGQTRSLHVRYMPECSDDGTLLSVLTIATDVTTLKQAEVRLAEQASQLEAIFEAQADGVAVHDREGRMVRANRAWQGMFEAFADINQWSADPTFATLPFAEQAERWHKSVRGRQYVLRAVDGHEMPLEQTPTYRALHGEALTGANAIDERFDRPDGHAYVISVSAAPIRDAAGQIVGAVAVSRDVTSQRQLERQVREQASQLEAIFEAQADPVVVYDQDRRLVRGNRAWEEVFRRLIDMRGLSADPAFLALPLIDQVSVANQQIWDERGRPLPIEELPTVRALQGETVTGERAVEERIQSPDGRDLWISVSAAPMRDAAGKITGAVVVGRDVTARRALERQVREQASQLEAVFEAMSDGVLVCDREERILQTNKALRRLLEDTDELGILPPASAAQNQWPMSYGDVARIMGPNQKFQWHTLQAEIIAGRGVRRTVIHFRGSRPAWIEIRGEPIRRPDGHISGAVLVMRDVTARRRLELELAQRERQYRTLVENSPDIIARFDRDLRYLYVNPAIRDISPIAPATYIGKTNAELGFPKAAYGLAHSTIEQVFQLGEGQTLEGADETFPDSSAARYFRPRFLPEFAADGSVESVLAVATDITPLKRTEQALLAAQSAAETARQKEEQRRKDAEWHRRVAESLRGVLGALNSKQPLSEILRLLVLHTGRLLGSEAAAIYGLESL